VVRGFLCAAIVCAAVVVSSRAFADGSATDGASIFAQDLPNREDLAAFPQAAVATVVAVRPGEVDVAPLSVAEITQGVRFTGSRLLGRVIRVDGTVATVRLPVDVRVHVGEAVTLEHTSGGGVDVIPPRLPGLSLSGEIRTFAIFPFFNSLANGGVQTLFSAEAIYRFEFPLALHATLAHASLAFTSPSNLAAVDLSAGPSFDTREFELGLFLGVVSVNDGYVSAAAGFAVEPFMRLGAVDGISLVGTMQTVLVSGSMQLAGGFGELSFPIANRYWWFFRGGASTVDGFANLDFGVRALVRGNGDHGSVFVRFSFGGAVTYFNPLSETVIGPGGGVGVEVRP